MIPGDRSKHATDENPRSHDTGHRLEHEHDGRRLGEVAPGTERFSTPSGLAAMSGRHAAADGDDAICDLITGMSGNVPVAAMS